MTTWEIARVDRSPLIVHVDAERNLAAEFDALVTRAVAATKTPWWKPWGRADVDPYWQITPKHRIHVALVAGVQPLRRSKPERRAVIGFQQPVPDAGDQG